MPLDYVDHRADPAAWAAQLGCRVDAAELLLDSHFIDLHVDIEVPARLYRYDPSVRHAPRTDRPPVFFGQTDFPRLKEAGVTGLAYDIATNPFRPEGNRQAATLRNVDAALDRIAAVSDEVAHVRTRADYDAAFAVGKLAAFLTLQGGNALASDPSVLQGPLGDQLHRITLVHLTSSVLGGTNSPAGRDDGITDRGRDFVERCNAARVLVDLAHAGKPTFWGALDAHSADLPPVVTHTGVQGVYDHWRNVDDDQIRAIADRGGVVGVMYQSSFLEPVRTFGSRIKIVEHLEHIMNVAGDDAAAIGTDYDGMIIPPRDLPDVTHHPLLVADMLDRGWSEQRVRKVLGLNYLRVVEAVRPG